MIRTFVDAGVLIAAARGTGVGAQSALKVLRDPNREFASSSFLKLEVLPKAIYNQRTTEAEFYNSNLYIPYFWQNLRCVYPAIPNENHFLRHSPIRRALFGAIAEPSRI